MTLTLTLTNAKDSHVMTGAAFFNKANPTYPGSETNSAEVQ